MVNLWGPGAFFCARPSATRPSLIPENGAGDPDDWLKDCTSVEARDGTELRASLLNALLAQLRGVVRNAGSVPDTNLDDLLLAKAMASGHATYAVATGTANAWTVAPALAVPAYAAGRVLNIIAPATNTSATVNLNVSTLGNRRIKKAGGADPAVGDLVSGRVYATIDDGTNIRILGDLPSDIAAQKALVNLQSVTNTTRTTTSGSGSGVFTTVLSGAFNKKSATSNLVLWLTHPVFIGGTGPSQLRLTVGGVNVSGVLAPSVAAQANGQTSLNAIVPGIAAGSVSWSIGYARSDGSAWTATANPTSTDVAYMPAATTTTLLCGEVEP